MGVLLGQRIKSMLTASEIRHRILSTNEEMISSILGRIEKQLSQKKDLSPLLFNLLKQEEAFAPLLTVELEALGYKVEYRSSVYEDHPCGAYIPTQLIIKF